MNKPDFEQGRNFYDRGKLFLKNLLELSPFSRQPSTYFVDWQREWPLPKSFEDNKFWRWARRLPLRSRQQLLEDLQAWEQTRLGIKKLPDGTLAPLEPTVPIPPVFKKAFEK